MLTCQRLAKRDLDLQNSKPKTKHSPAGHLSNDSRRTPYKCAPLKNTKQLLCFLWTKNMKYGALKWTDPVTRKRADRNKYLFMHSCLPTSQETISSWKCLVSLRQRVENITILSSLQQVRKLFCFIQYSKPEGTNTIENTRYTNYFNSLQRQDTTKETIFFKNQNFRLMPFSHELFPINFSPSQ